MSEPSSHNLLGRGRLTRCDLLLQRARQGLEGVLFVMARDTAHHAHWSVFGMVVDFMQLLAYPLYSGYSFPWCVAPRALCLQALTCTPRGILLAPAPNHPP